MSFLLLLLLFLLSYAACFGAIEHRICFARHPLLQLFYLTLVTVGFLVVYQNTYPKFSLPHQIACWVTLFSVLLSLTIASFSDPGVVTAERAPRMVASYEYDGCLYVKDKMCETCNLPKPARSKHCSLCGKCVARFDHHCAWINNCVGANNHRYFILFVLLSAWMCAYCCWAESSLTISIIVNKGLFTLYSKYGWSLAQLASAVLYFGGAHIIMALFTACTFLMLYVRLSCCFSLK